MTARLSIGSDSIIDAGFMRPAQHPATNRNVKIGRIALAVLLSVGASVLVFTCTFGAVDLYWSRFHVRPGSVPSADGAVMMELGRVLGTLLGSVVALIVLVRLWPKDAETGK
jgi:hypothetical protein